MRKGDPRFHEVLKMLGDLHDRKQQDYGADGDPFANIRASERWGIPAWVGALVRLNDKVHRLQQFALKGELANESAEDSMLDIPVYSIIALILYREESAKTATADGIRSEQQSRQCGGLDCPCMDSLDDPRDYLPEEESMTEYERQVRDAIQEAFDRPVREDGDG